MERTGQGETVQRLLVDQIAASTIGAEVNRPKFIEKSETLFAELKRSNER